MATATAKRTPKEPETDVIVLEQDDESFTAEIFGEEFRFSSYVNPWLLMMLTTGDNTARSLLKLIHSILEVDIPDDAPTADADEVRQKEADRFSDLIGSRRDLTFERLFRLVNDLIAAAGNDQATSPGD